MCARAVDTPATLQPFVPRPALEWLRDHPDDRRLKLDVTLVMIDVSGFTALSERLARLGKVGAEELTDVIGHTFAELLARAYAFGGSLLKFGGDALFLLFGGPAHTNRGCAAAFEMRAALREIGPIKTSAATVRLRMSVGVHTGQLHLFLVGDSHRELVVTGPSVTETLRMEAIAGPNQIVVSPATAEAMDPRFTGKRVEGGYLLARAPDSPRDDSIPEIPRAVNPGRLVSRSLVDALAAAGGEPEHRQVTTAFLRFQGVDERLRAGRARTVERQIDRLIALVQEAAETYDVCFLGTDVLSDGGKIVLTAGAPRTTVNDEERALLAVRHVLDRYRGLDISAGLDRGYVFSGPVGPPYRRTYTVMGDAVNTAARLMARAASGRMLASRRVLERSDTVFEEHELEPFAVKGKTELQHAAEVGAVRGVRLRARPRLRLVGRDAQIARLSAHWNAARAGEGRLVVVTGERGIGKTRLVEELKERVDADVVEAIGHPYASLTPYHVLGQLMAVVLGGFPTADRLRRRVREAARDIEPWLPLLGIPLGVEFAATPETESLDPSFRAKAIERTVVRFLREISPGEVLWVVEEAESLDAASAGVLRALAAGARDRPWLIVAAGRHDGGLGSVAVESIELEPLPPEDASRLAVEAAGGSLLPDTARRLADRSAGHPLFLVELVPHADEGALPSNLEAIVAARIDELPSEDRAVLRRLAVLGREFDRDRVRDLSDDRSGTGSIERLGAFLEDTDGRLRFRLALYQEVAYEGLPYRTRRDLHAHIGEVLESAGESADVLSLHFEQAGDHDRTWRYASEAAHSARARSAHVEAADLYRRSLRAATRLDVPQQELARVAFELGESLQWSGRLAEAADVYRDARRRTGIPGEQAMLYQREGAVRAQLGQVRRAAVLFGRGLRTVAQVEGSRERWRLCGGYASLRHKQGRHGDAYRWGLRALEEAEGSGERSGIGHACNILYLASEAIGREGAGAFAERALAVFEEENLPAFAADVLNNLGKEAKRDGRWDEAVNLFERSRRALEAAGNTLAAAVVMNNEANLLKDQGHYVKAVEVFGDALATFRAAGYAQGVMVVMLNLSRARAYLGHLDEAALLVRDVLSQARSGPVAIEAHLCEAETMLLRGCPDEAAGVLEGIDEEIPDDLVPLQFRLYGHTAWQRGDLGAARRAFEEALDRARSAAEMDRAAAVEALARVTGDADHAAEVEQICRRLRVVARPWIPR